MTHKESLLLGNSNVLKTINGFSAASSGSEVSSDVIPEVRAALQSFVWTYGIETDDDVKVFLSTFFQDLNIKKMLTKIIKMQVFEHELYAVFSSDLDVLASFKQLKYYLNIPIGQVFEALSAIYAPLPTSKWWAAMKGYVIGSQFSPVKVNDFLKCNSISTYSGLREQLELSDPHAVYPTNIYRSCDGFCLSTQDFSTIECVMSTSLTTTIKIRKGVLQPGDHTLSSVYKPLGRCIAIIDDKVDALYGEQLEGYFKHHDVNLNKLVYRGNEVDKEMEKVEQILVDLKMNGVSRNEPVLIVGGGVIADIGGFACGLYHRSTPYIMLCTSIVSGVDAGPSPRTCCDGFGYKNLYGAYHPPVQTITDRYFFKSLHEGWLRHGIAEIIKMSVTKDFELFQLVEKAGPRLIRTKFGTELAEADDEFEELCDLIIGRAVDSYVKSEYGNLWETHQCRPHAYGHTWSPGYELSSGMLHGHAVATGMGLGAYLSYVEGWISRAELGRILGLISTMELALWHPIMDDIEMIWGSQVKMMQKRGGNLCAPVPKNTIGQCGYINDISKEQLEQRLAEYKNLCQSYPRLGLGVDMHCVEVGLEDPSVTAQRHVISERALGKEKDGGSDMSYNEWIQQAQTVRNSEWKFNVTFHTAEDTPHPPHFEKVTLFHPGVEQYAMDMTSVASENVQIVAGATLEKDMFAPCMVGTLESQFLKMQVALSGARRCLDVGTFTGMSAMAMAEGMAKVNGEVITLEFDEETANVAEECFLKSDYAQNITLIRGSAEDAMKQLLKDGVKFDVIFLDADKENYIKYYDIAMSGLLTEKGFIMADNSLCALLYDDGDYRSQKLHEFNQHVKNDPRVEQVVLTMREGVTLIMPK